MASGWRKSPDWLVAIFDVGFPADRRAQRRSMFGYPAGFVNGNMFSGLFQDSLFVRLPEGDREALLAIEGAAPFEPMAGRPMREYVVLPMEMLEDAETTRRWIRRAFDYGAGLPAKGGEVKPAAKATKTARTAKAATRAVPRARSARTGEKTVSTAGASRRGKGSRGPGGRRGARSRPRS